MKLVEMPDFDRMAELEAEADELEEMISRLDVQIEDAEEDGDFDKAEELEAERDYRQQDLDEVREELERLKELEWQIDNAPAWAW